MKKILYFIYMASIVILLSGNSNLANASYTTVWAPSSGELTLDFTGWNPYYIDSGGYRVAKLDFSLSNPTSNTYYDVNMVVPFVWEDFTPAATPAKQAATWDNTNQEWINDYLPSGDVDGNGLYVKVYSGPNSPTYSYLAMNATDLPTSSSYSGYETATVSSTDSIPAWLLDSMFTPNESATFSIYLEYEKHSTATPNLTSLWLDPFVVASAVPIPSAVWLLGSAFIGLVGCRRRFKR